ncbi:unnamed protein product [Cuscuta epithymum]|uniref:Uncharacterized protein n=1 Tax=Cuscuta epithymum TaxID=186058 RepID=A0AAV0CH06_9ASTE|nr:unnamed protein product [Cuscuta epithymum]
MEIAGIGKQGIGDQFVADEENRAVQGTDNAEKMIGLFLIGASTIVERVRPPPEPPPRVDLRALEFASDLPFRHFNFQVKTFVFCCYFILCCKTLALGLGDGKSAVTVIGSKLPNFGLASYTAFLQVVNSQSRPRADGYMWFFSAFVPLLNAISMN